MAAGALRLRMGFERSVNTRQVNAGSTHPIHVVRACLDFTFALATRRSTLERPIMLLRRTPDRSLRRLGGHSRRCFATPSSLITAKQTPLTSQTPLSNLEKDVYLPYPQLQGNLEIVRRRLNGRSLTLSEKILFSHLCYPETQDLERGKSTLAIRPDRAACHDATATMAMLQFISAGLPKVALPTSIHSDHLIVAEKGAKEDLEAARKNYAEVSVARVWCDPLSY